MERGEVVARVAQRQAESRGSTGDQTLRRKTFVACVFASAVATANAGAQKATFLDYQTTVPAGWTTRAPSSTSRLAEYVVPARDGAPGAEVVVYFFGAKMAANVDANLDRWRDQFTNDGVKPSYERVTRDSSGAFPVTFVELHGTYRRGIGTGSADSVHTGQALIAAIVPTPRGPLFIQIFGPEARVVAERETFKRFVTDLK